MRQSCSPPVDQPVPLHPPPPKPGRPRPHLVLEGRKFEDMRDDLKAAIRTAGWSSTILRTSTTCSNAPARTSARPPRSPKDAEAFSFCSATVSRDTMEADPHNIVFCHTITAYVTGEGTGEGLVSPSAGSSQSARRPRRRHSRRCTTAQRYRTRGRRKIMSVAACGDVNHYLRVAHPRQGDFLLLAQEKVT